MKRSALTTTIVVAGLALAACGSDSGSDDDGGGNVQSEVVDMTMEQAADAGFTLDEGCVDDIAQQLSDDDANAILAGDDDEISEEGELLSVDLIDCVQED